MGVIALGTWQFPDRPWEFDAEAARAQAAASGESGEGAPEPVRLALSQAVFEAQQPLLEQQLQALTPERAGVTDVYGLVFAPYAGEEVFRRESTPSPQPQRRLERARWALEQGRYRAAIDEVKGMPGASKADAWIADAERYRKAMEAMEVIETAAVLDQERKRVADFTATLGRLRDQLTRLG